MKELVAQVFPEVEKVVCYQEGFDALHAAPFFPASADEAGRAVFNPLCVHNLATYLPALKKKKTAVVVKGCDSRTIIQLLQENLIDREKIVIIGVPCRGVISVSRVLQAVSHEPVKEIRFEPSGEVVVTVPGGEKRFPLLDVAPDKCRTCLYPTPLIYDHLISDPVTSDKAREDVYADVKELEAMPIEERLEYWKKELDRCIRCYACRNACPMCVCRESCIVESRSPHWMSQRNSIDEKLMFHMIHAVHLAGRCVECGECERACPMDIPIVKLKKKINMEMKELFNYEPGVKLDEKPPMYIFNVDEATIKEHKLS